MAARPRSGRNKAERENHVELSQTCTGSRSTLSSSALTCTRPHGSAIGLAGAALTTRYLRELLFGLTPLDPPTFVSVAVVVIGAALAASYFPARRATAIDPLVALRTE